MDKPISYIKTTERTKSVEQKHRPVGRSNANQVDEFTSVTGHECLRMTTDASVMQVPYACWCKSDWRMTAAFNTHLMYVLGVYLLLPE